MYAKINKVNKYADVAELADVQDLGSIPCMKPKFKMQNAKCKMK